MIDHRIDKIRESSETGADLRQTKRYFVEIGCLFVMNQGSGILSGHVTLM